MHGANRLGGNSLLDLIVFGRAAGIHTEQAIREGLSLPQATPSAVEEASGRFYRWQKSQKGESVAHLRAEMQKIMQRDFGVFRKGEFMEQGFERTFTAPRTSSERGFERSKSCVQYRPIEAFELENLMSIAIATAFAAVHRTESRGAHFREDYPKRDDANWLKHLLYFEKGDAITSRASI